jgi:RNA polymerase sigma-70 factor, ECF subfamily
MLATSEPRGKLWLVLAGRQFVERRSRESNPARQSGRVKNMAGSAALPSTQEAALVLHQRLLAQDPTAANDLAEAYLEALVVWLGETDARAPEDVRIEAAEDAILALIRNPASYSPKRQTLEVYLRMSARGDLRNRLRKERRHQTGRMALTSVELLPDSGKYLGHTDDPSLPLRIAQEKQSVVDGVPDSLNQGLSETDRRALEMILRKERRTSVYAELYGLQHLSAQEQVRQVKRHKDRLKKLLQRGGRKR